MLPYFRHNQTTLTDFRHTLESAVESTLARFVPVLNYSCMTKMCTVPERRPIKAPQVRHCKHLVSDNKEM